jgi:hypothetical protein
LLEFKIIRVDISFGITSTSNPPVAATNPHALHIIDLQ